MRICYIADSIVPSRSANSIHVMKMCQALADLGHDVTLLVPGYRERIAGTDPFAFYSVRKAFSIEYLPWLPVKGRGYVFAWLAARRAAKLDVGLTISRHVPSACIAARTGLSTLLELHQPVPETDSVVRWCYARLLVREELVGIVAITGALGAALVADAPVLADRLLVAPDGADPVDPPVASGPPARFSAGYTGHLYRGKGMEVIAELAARCGWADFHVVGGTDTELREWRAATAHLPNVIYHGFVPQHEVRTIMAKFDCCLLPNQKVVHAYSSHATKRVDIGAFTSPLKMFEYMAAGKAIIASDLPVLREVLSDEVALLCRPDDIDAWVAALARLRDEPALRERLGVAARRLLLAKYTWRARAERLVAFAEERARAA